MECVITEKTHKKFWIVVLIIAVLCFLAGLTYFIGMKIRSDKVDDLKNRVYVSGDGSSDVSSGFNYVETPVNFVELKKINPEIYAWINIPGTNIDYPILRRDDDNSYYLEHTVEGKRSVYGSIYTENYNDKNFDDFNTLIYGHNMKNGTMFGSLKKYKNKSIAQENRYINIYLPGRILKYQIFAAHISDNKHILLNNDFSDKNVCSEYLEKIFSVRQMNSFIDSELEIDENDKIITLSTCTSKKEERFLVQGVLIYDSREQ